MDLPVEPKSMVEHFDFLWIILCLAAIGLFGVTLSWFNRHQKRIDVLESNQKKVLKIIPEESWVHSVRLVSEQGCGMNRENCQNIVISEELAESMKIIKKAICVLVLHTDNVPSEDKQAIMKELI